MKLLVPICLPHEHFQIIVFIIMHQSERVSSTSDKNDADDSHDNNIDDDSDIDSWPEDAISPNDSKHYTSSIYYSCITLLYYDLYNFITKVSVAISLS